MNKKFKKMIATVSAVAMCSVPVSAISASAMPVGLSERINQYTTSFTLVDGTKYNFWQAGTDFLGDENDRVFISEPLTKTDDETGEEKIYYDTILFHQYYSGQYTYSEVHEWRNADSLRHFSSKKGGVNDGKIELIAEYLSENNISYTINEYSNTTAIKFDNEGMNCDETAELATKIRKYVDWSFAEMVFPLMSFIEITDIENALPEPTLTGDATEDGEVNIADAVLIMQSLSNPNEYKLTPQGMANADMDGDGVTALDALTIQQMLLDK